MEAMIMKQHEGVCERCGEVLTIDGFDLCKSCEELVEEEYRLLYQKEDSIEMMSE